MNTYNPTAESENWAKEAMARIAKDGLSPIPDNFAIYYAYLSGENPNLRMAMDAVLKQFGSLNQAQCTQLYQAHLGLEAERKALTSASNSIETELKKVLNALDSSASTSKNYTDKLDNFSGEMQQNLTIEQIKQAVVRVVNETRIMAEQNQRLQTQLAQSTQQLTEVRYNFDQVRKESLIDPLTEVGNRKYFRDELFKVTQESADQGSPLCLLMIDIDHFKKFNDSFGHLIGDQVLRLVARTMVENLKGRDIIARYGGEEFVIVLPHTRLADAVVVGNLLRGSLATKQIKRKNTNQLLGIITVSIGATEYYAHEELDGFIARADTALYEAKQTGRNKIVTKSVGQV